MMELETFFTVPQQIRLLLYAVFLGFPLGFCFDLLRSIRAVLPHGKLAAALEDIHFCCSGAAHWSAFPAFWHGVKYGDITYWAASWDFCCTAVPWAF